MSNNPTLFNSILAGAVGGIQQRWLTSNSVPSYDSFRAIVQAIAVRVDSLIPARNEEYNVSETTLMSDIVSAVLAGRFPASANQADYTDIASAIVTLFTSMQSALDPAVVPVATTDIGYTVAAPKQIVLMPAPHIAGVYNISASIVMRQFGTGGTVTIAFQNDQPNFGPLLAPIGNGVLASQRVMFNAVRTVASSGLGPILLIYTPNAPTGAPIMDTYVATALQARG